VCPLYVVATAAVTVRVEFDTGIRWRAICRNMASASLKETAMPRHLPALFTASLACVGLAACGSGGATSPSGVGTESAAQIVHAVRAAVSGYSSAHMSGTASSGGQQITLDLVVVAPKGVSGTMGISGTGTFKLTTTDGATFYITPDEAFWRHYAGTTPGVLPLLVGKCILAGPSSSEFAALSSGVSNFSDLSAVVDQALTTPADLTKGPTSVVHGQVVIPLIGKDGSELDVAAQGSPLPVEFSKSGADGGKVDFDHWNSAGNIKAPSGCIDFSHVTAGLPTPHS
jgi:hypothetical protein